MLHFVDQFESTERSSRFVYEPKVTDNDVVELLQQLEDLTSDEHADPLDVLAEFNELIKANPHVIDYAVQLRKLTQVDKVIIHR